MNARRRAAWSTFGPHAIGAERFVAVSSGASFAQVAGAILQKRIRVEIPDKDEIPGFKSWRTAEQGDQVHMHVGARRSDPPI